MAYLTNDTIKIISVPIVELSVNIFSSTIFILRYFRINKLRSSTVIPTYMILSRDIAF